MKQDVSQIGYAIKNQLENYEEELVSAAKKIKRNGYGREDLASAMSVEWPLISFNGMDIDNPSGYQYLIDATQNMLDTNFVRRIVIPRDQVVVKSCVTDQENLFLLIDQQDYWVINVLMFGISYQNPATRKLRLPKNNLLDYPKFFYVRDGNFANEMRFQNN